MFFVDKSKFLTYSFTQGKTNQHLLIESMSMGFDPSHEVSISFTTLVPTQKKPSNRYKWSELVPTTGRKYICNWGCFTPISRVKTPTNNPPKKRPRNLTPLLVLSQTRSD